MKLRILSLFTTLYLLSPAQVDTAVTVPLIGVNFGGQLPMGDLTKRFGPNLRLGGNFMLKTRSNWLLGIEANYLFSRNVKQDVLVNLKTPEGYVVDNEGYPADLRVSERGITLHAQVGRLFVNKHDGANSGVMLCVGLGYLQHKINLYDAQQRIAAVKGDLKKGYDHLTGGVCPSLFLGYLHLGENRLLNYYFGLESYVGFTKSFRKISYDTGLPDISNRIDILSGLRVGWILPLYPRKPNDFYYN